MRLDEILYVHQYTMCVARRYSALPQPSQPIAQNLARIECISGLPRVCTNNYVVAAFNMRRDATRASLKNWCMRRWAANKCINMRRDRLTAASTWASKITLHNYCILHLDAQCSDRWCDLEVVTAAYKNIQILNEFPAASSKPGQLKRNSILTYPSTK